MISSWFCQESHGFQVSVQESAGATGVTYILCQLEQVMLDSSPNIIFVDEDYMFFYMLR